MSLATQHAPSIQTVYWAEGSAQRGGNPDEPRAGAPTPPQVRARSRRLHSSTAAGSLVLADQAQSATGAAFAERVHSDRSAVNRLACTVWGEHLVWLAGVHVQLEWACTVSQGHQRNKAMGPRPTMGERWAVAELRLVQEDDGGGDAL